MLVVGTGHRPDKLFKSNPYSLDNFIRLAAYIQARLQQCHPSHVISGMALGFDQALAHAALSLGIPFTAAVPFSGQDRSWPQDSQHAYNGLLKQAAEIVVITPGAIQGSWCILKAMDTRNKWMVDQLGNGDVLLTMWNGSKSGTANCIAYATTFNLKHSTPTFKCRAIEIVNIWEDWKP